MIKHYIVVLHRKLNPREVPYVNTGIKSSHSYLCWWKMLVEFLRTPNIWGCVSTLSNNGRGKGLKMNIQSSLFCTSQDSGMSQTKLLFFALCHIQGVQTPWIWRRRWMVREGAECLLAVSSVAPVRWIFNVAGKGMEKSNTCNSLDSQTRLET